MGFHGIKVLFYPDAVKVFKVGGSEMDKAQGSLRPSEQII
jgi:hypothetical protein